MRTLVAADEPERRAGVSAGSTTGGMADAALVFVVATGVTVSPWQAVVIHQAYAVNGRLFHRPLR